MTYFFGGEGNYCNVPARRGGLAQQGGGAVDFI